MDRVARFLGGASGVDVGVLLLVHFNLFVYALCYWVEQPLLPFLSKELGVEGARSKYVGA